MAGEHVNEIVNQLPHVQNWVELVYQGIADNSVADAVVKPAVICPQFGEPGWGPLCFLNGNPVFNAFDKFQPGNIVGQCL